MWLKNWLFQLEGWEPQITFMVSHQPHVNKNCLRYKITKYYWIYKIKKPDRYSQALVTLIRLPTNEQELFCNRRFFCRGLFFSLQFFKVYDCFLLAKWQL